MTAHDPGNATSRPDDRLVWDALLGMFVCPVLLVSRERKLYSTLAAGARSRDELAEATGIARRPLEALLSVNAAAGLLAHSDGGYALTAAARAYLLDDSPTSFGGFLDMIAALYPMYSLDGLRRVVAADAPISYGGEDTFKTHEAQAELARTFTRAMHGMSAGPAAAWAAAASLTDHHTMLDVGGGSGVYSVEAAARWPQLSAVVLDLPPVCEVARELAAARGLDARVTATPGDMWNDPFPPADLHFYSMIFHDWPLEKCRILAAKSFASLPAGGTIMVHEMLYDDRKAGPLSIAAFSVSMLFGTQGEQYSGREIAALLADTGFVSIEIKPSFGYWSTIAARKP